MSRHIIGFCIHTTRVHSSTRPYLQESADSHSFSEPTQRVLSGARTNHLYTIVFTLLLHRISTHLQVLGFHNSWPHSGWVRKGKRCCSFSSKEHIQGVSSTSNHLADLCPAPHPQRLLLIHFSLSWFAWFTETW